MEGNYGVKSTTPRQQERFIESMAFIAGQKVSGTGMISDREQTESGRNSCGRVRQTKKRVKSRNIVIRLSPGSGTAQTLLFQIQSHLQLIQP